MLNLIPFTLRAKRHIRALYLLKASGGLLVHCHCSYIDLLQCSTFNHIHKKWWFRAIQVSSIRQRGFYLIWKEDNERSRSINNVLEGSHSARTLYKLTSFAAALPGVWNPRLKVHTAETHLKLLILPSQYIFQKLSRFTTSPGWRNVDHTTFSLIWYYLRRELPVTALMLQ